MDINELILEKIEFKEDFTFIAPIYTALQVMERYIELDKIEYIEEEFESYCSIVAISFVNGYWIIEDAIYENEIKYMSNDIFFVDKDILDEIDLHSLEGNIMLLEIESDYFLSDILLNEECEEEYDWLDEVTQDCLEELEDEEKCAFCTIKKYLSIVQEIAIESTLEEINEEF